VQPGNVNNLGAFGNLGGFNSFGNRSGKQFGFNAGTGQ
jgi:hypothetical protein